MYLYLVNDGETSLNVLKARYNRLFAKHNLNWKAKIGRSTKTNCGRHIYIQYANLIVSVVESKTARRFDLSAVNPQPKRLFIYG